MEIRDTIQSDDIRCDGWIDKDTAEASIRQTEATLKRYTPVYDAQCKEYPRGVEPFRDCIFAEWHVDTDEVVYWLDLDNDILLVTDEIGCGVVPIDPVERQWREETGRLCCLLAQRAQRVERIFCGIAMTLKATEEDGQNEDHTGATR